LLIAFATVNKQVEQKCFALNPATLLSECFLLQGIEAAAVPFCQLRHTETALEAIPGRNRVRLCERPFVFLIKDQASGAVVFMGRMGSPKRQMIETPGKNSYEEI
jgi:hypothetical protein